MMGVALLVFLYGCFEFIRSADNDGARTTGKKHILWGIIGFVVMVSAYAILQVAAGTIGCDADNPTGCGPGVNELMREEQFFR